MTPHRILILYGTSYGHTAKIAARLEQLLSAAGFPVMTADAATMASDIDLADFDAAIIGASVIGGKHQRAITRFIEAHLETLNRLPSAFISVSGSAASADSKRQSDARMLMERYLDGLAWHPDLLTTLGGAYAFTRYPWFLRWIMKQITRRNGGPTDTTHDHDLTDWEHVDEFAHRFARIVEPVELIATGMRF